MDCNQYVDQWNAFLANNSPNSSQSAGSDKNEELEFYIYRVALPIVCAFGILGNILNLIVLLQHQIRRSMDYMEKSAHMGLVALAASDMLFCIIAFPTAFVEKSDMYVGSKMMFAFYYKGYSLGLMNIFLLSSTWLVVVMACARYLAICWPLHSRGYINLPVTLISILSVFVLSVVITLPDFWHLEMSNHPCPLNPACDCHITGAPTSVFYTNKALHNTYFSFRGIIGTVVPMVVLAFCNINLIRALRQSSKMQRKYRANAPKESSHRITLTLVTMIILFIILVCPALILVFFKDMGMKPYNDKHHYAYNAITWFFNLTQAVNFSINFVLYCIINVHFRQVVKYILCCRCFRKKGPRDYRPTTNHSLVTQTECLNIEDTEIELQTRPNRKQ